MEAVQGPRQKPSRLAARQQDLRMPTLERFLGFAFWTTPELGQRQKMKDTFLLFLVYALGVNVVGGWFMSNVRVRLVQVQTRLATHPAPPTPLQPPPHSYLCRSGACVRQYEVCLARFRELRELILGYKHNQRIEVFWQILQKRPCHAFFVAGNSVSSYDCIHHLLPTPPSKNKDMAWECILVASRVSELL